MTANIIMITHPHTQWTLEGRYQGHIDVPLNEVGYSMVDRLVERLADEEISYVYSSDLQRSFQTAAIVAESKGIAHGVDARLREGRWEPQEDIHSYPVLDFNVESESRKEVCERVVEVMGEIAEKHDGETVFVVSHWGATNLFVSHVLNYDRQSHAKYLGALAALNWFEYNDGHWHCVLLNEDGFLSGIQLCSD